MSTKNLIDEMIAQAKLSKKQTDKQQKIVEASIKIFAEKGFANTSTSEMDNRYCLLNMLLNRKLFLLENG
ncbi:hypothetical protein [Metabacillus idriensis]|uniref:hypothetical protein n=1 Tax=Metabacillus idriensis TaxID=324768 RepID=UPI00174E65CB|nr:hypothetical protein [Metabacillus idriensis]